MTSEIENGLDFEVNVRFFDSARSDDLKGLKETVKSPGVKQWMVGLDNLKQKDLEVMMSFTGKHRHFMFAVTRSVKNVIEDDRIHGFLFFCPSPAERSAIEVSFAKRPNSPSGLIVVALRKACLEVRTAVNTRKGLDPNEPVRIVAGTLPGNLPSMKVLLGAGFEHEKNLENGNCVYALDWMKLEQIISDARQPLTSLSPA